MKIRSQLLLVMVIALFVTTSLVADVQIYTAYRQQQENMEAILQNQANQFSNQMETWFTMITQNGHFFVNQQFVQNANQEEMQKLLGNLHNDLGVFNQLMVATPDGTVTNIYPFNPNVIGNYMGNYAYFKDTIALKTSQISKVTTNAKTGKTMIIVTQPIMNSNGEITAVLLEDINLDLLQDMADDAKIGDTGQTIIFSADGQIITERGSQTYGPLATADTLSEVLKKDLHDSVTFTNSDGKKVIVATNRVRTPGWGIAVTITQDEVLQSFYKSVKYGVATFCIIFLLIAFISSIVFRRLFRSITIVTEQFANMNSGNFSSLQINENLIKSAPQELRQLCTTFNTMSQTIKNNIELLRTTNDALLVSEERWQLSIRGSSDGIWDWNISTNEIFFSPRVKLMFGYDETDKPWTMDDWQEKIHPDDYEMVKQLLEDHFAQKIAFFSAEYRFLCKDNTFKWAFIRGQAVWDEKNLPVRIVGSISDITERKEAEEQLKEAHNELELKVERRTQDLVAANQELLAMNEELQQTLENLQRAQTQLVQSEKMASLGNLVAGIAHEINTPIGVSVTAISHLQSITKDFMQLYRDKGLKRSDLTAYLEESDEAATIISTNLERASQLVRSFKQVSVDQSSEVKRVFNVSQYLDELLLSLQPKLKRTQHKVTIDCDEKLELDSFPGAFAQIITNLIMNSLVHAYEPNDAGQMTIHVETIGKQTIQLTYADDGKGMEPSVIEKIFNPFFTTKRGMGGTGLGLYIVYNIVTQQFKGKIKCISQLHKGTKFIIQFPWEREVHSNNE